MGVDAPKRHFRTVNHHPGRYGQRYNKNRDITGVNMPHTDRSCLDTDCDFRLCWNTICTYSSIGTTQSLICAFSRNDPYCPDADCDMNSQFYLTQPVYSNLQHQIFMRFVILVRSCITLSCIYSLTQCQHFGRWWSQQQGWGARDLVHKDHQVSVCFHDSYTYVLINTIWVIQTGLHPLERSLCNYTRVCK